MKKIQNIGNHKNVPTISYSYTTSHLAPPNMRVINGEQRWYSDYGPVAAYQNYGDVNGHSQIYLKTDMGVVYTNCRQGLERAQQEHREFEQWRETHPQESQKYDEIGNAEVLNQTMLDEFYGQQHPAEQKPQELAKPSLKEKLNNLFPFSKEAKSADPKVDLNNITYVQTRVAADGHLVKTGIERQITAPMLEAVVTLSQWGVRAPDLNQPVVDAFGMDAKTIERFNDFLMYNQKQPLLQSDWNYLLQTCQITFKDIQYGPSVQINNTHGQKMNSFGMVKQFSHDKHTGEFSLQSTSRAISGRGNFVSRFSIDKQQGHHFER